MLGEPERIPPRQPRRAFPAQGPARIIMPRGSKRLCPDECAHGATACASGCPERHSRRIKPSCMVASGGVSGRVGLLCLFIARAVSDGFTQTFAGYADALAFWHCASGSGLCDCAGVAARPILARNSGSPARYDTPGTLACQRVACAGCLCTGGDSRDRVHTVRFFLSLKLPPSLNGRAAC